jgi:hypothetical protein
MAAMKGDSAIQASNSEDELIKPTFFSSTSQHIPQCLTCPATPTVLPRPLSHFDFIPKKATV